MHKCIWPLQMIFLKICIKLKFSLALQGGGRVGKEEAKPPQVKTRGHQLSRDGPDDATRPKRHHSGQGWCAPQVSMCWSWFYKAVNPPLRKADHLQLSLAIGEVLCG